MFYKGDGKAGEGNSRDFFFCMQEPSFLESEEKGLQPLRASVVTHRTYAKLTTFI